MSSSPQEEHGQGNPFVSLEQEAARAVELGHQGAEALGAHDVTEIGDRPALAREAPQTRSGRPKSPYTF
jgi:hypothetical protein